MDLNVLRLKKNRKIIKDQQQLEIRSVLNITNECTENFGVLKLFFPKTLFFQICIIDFFQESGFN